MDPKKTHTNYTSLTDFIFQKQVKTVKWVYINTCKTLWWPNHIVPAHVSRVAKNIECCVWKTSQDCISVYMLLWFQIWENYFNSHTIITTWWELSPLRYIL